MEYTGFEPVASTMRMLRAPNCANTPYMDLAGIEPASKNLSHVLLLS